jgi:XTP/dITP diphosphohydrolase
MEEVGITDDVLEDGDTYEANAIKKAITVCQLTGTITLADDSGLEIDCMDKQPGIYSARFMGKDTPYVDKNRFILDRMKGIPDWQRTARFVCVIAAAFPGGNTHTVKGVIEGQIAYETGSGKNGFGYDPIFYLPEFGKTMCEIPVVLKNEISHRGLALKEIKAYLSAKWGG